MLMLVTSLNWHFFVVNYTSNSISHTEWHSPSCFANLPWCNCDLPSWESQIHWVSSSMLSAASLRDSGWAKLFLFSVGSFHISLTNFVEALNFSVMQPLYIMWQTSFQTLQSFNNTGSSSDAGAGQSSVVNWGISTESQRQWSERNYLVRQLSLPRSVVTA